LIIEGHDAAALRVLPAIADVYKQQRSCTTAACTTAQRPAPCSHQDKGFKVVGAPLDLSTGDEAQQHDARIAPHIVPEVCQQLILRDAAFYTCKHHMQVGLSQKLPQNQLMRKLLQALPCSQ
jgi:hypothetical protein